MSLKQYKGYKDSGVNWLGNLPVEWKISKFRHVATICKGKCPDQLSDVKSITTQVPYLTMDYLRGNTENIRWLNPTNDTLLASEKDVLLLWDGSNAGEFITARPGAVSSTMAVLYNKFLHDRYFFYVCKSIESEIQQATIGMGIPHVNGDFIKDTPIPFPTSKEQVAIATFLDQEISKIDKLVTDQQRLVELLKNKRQAVISHAVTKGLNPRVPMKDSGIHWLGKVPKHWEIITLKRIAYIVSGFAFPSDDFCDDGIPVLRIGDIKSDGKVGMESCKYVSNDYSYTHNFFYVRKGELVIAMTGATVGKIGWYMEEVGALVNQRVGVFKTTLSLNYQFMWYALSSQGYLEHIRLTAFGGAQPNISDVDLLNFETSLPPVEEQISIATFLGRETGNIEALISEAQQAIGLLQERRTALITATVTGKVDVRGLIESEKNT